LHTSRFALALSTRKFPPVPLPVVKSQGMKGILPLPQGEKEDGGVYSSADQNNRFLHGVHSFAYGRCK